MDHSLTINFSSLTADVSLLIEQDEWVKPPASGFQPWLDENNYTLNFSNIAMLLEMYYSQCNDDGDIVTTFRVYRSEEFNYNFIASYGTLSTPRIISNEVIVESVDVNFVEEVSIIYGKFFSAEWEGPVYRADGSQYFAPLHINIDEVDAKRIYWLDDDDNPVNVVGRLRTVVIRSYDAYVLTIRPRDVTEDQQAAESFKVSSQYESRVMAFYEGKFIAKEVELPELDNVQCGGDGIVIIDPEDPEGPFLVECDAFDYCTGDDIASPDIWVDGTLRTDWPITLDAGEHTIVVRAPGYQDTDDDDLTDNDTFTLE